MNETTTFTHLVEIYIAAWNETDPTTRHDLIAQVWAEDATYIDPMMQGQGHSAIDGLIQGAHTLFPNHRFELVSGPEVTGDCLRFSWHLMPIEKSEGQPAVAGGTDFCVLASDGRMQSVTGFLDFAPNLNI